MSQGLWPRSGGASPDEAWEARLAETARSFVYPATPNIAESLRQQLRAERRPHAGLVRRGWVWAALISLAILGGLLSVPQVRAAVVEFLQIGVIRILLTDPTPTPIPTPTPPPATPAGRAATPSPVPTASPVPTPLTSVLDLAGETTLAEAQASVDFPIRLPAYPAELGPPDRVFHQNLNGPAVILVWLEPDRPERVRLSLHQLGRGIMAEKGNPGRIEETTVNGQRAIWAEGPYMLQFRRGNQVEFDLRRLVDGHVLIWTEDDMTYRLETDLPLAEAVRVAESLE
jgi:hypothetical protein